MILLVFWYNSNSNADTQLRIVHTTIMKPIQRAMGNWKQSHNLGQLLQSRSKIDLINVPQSAL